MRDTRSRSAPIPMASASASRARNVRQTMVQMTITGERVLPSVQEVVIGLEEAEQSREQSRQADNSTAMGSGASTDNAMPKFASIHRPRAIKRKAPEGPRGHGKSGRCTKETKVTAVQRLKEFDGHGLTLSAGKLYCQACHEVQPNIKESIKRHLLTSKHIKNMEAYVAKEEANEKVKERLSEHFDKNTHEKGVRSSFKCA